MAVFSIEARRNMSIPKIGKTHTEATKDKLRGIDRRPFPPKCVLCINRDFIDCAKYNLTCFDAKKTECFQKQTKRKEHPDYVAKLG